MTPLTSRRIDLNADVGEGTGTEDLLAPLCSSWNLCCGAHAGSPEDLDRALELAKTYGISCGAHPGHSDREYFGRVAIPIDRSGLRKLIVPQIETVARAAQKHGLNLTHLKLHGALYHQAGSDPELAEETILVAGEFGLLIFGFPGSVLANLATPAGHFVPEGFADRGMDSQGNLLSRGTPGAILHDPGVAAQQGLRLALSDREKTLCVHGDSPDAVRMLSAVRTKLLEEGFQIAAPTMEFPRVIAP
jgi:UPF0271 protein